MNEVINNMLAHRSVRSFTDRAVNDEELDAIIRAVPIGDVRKNAKEAVYFEETYNPHLEKQLAEYDKTYSQYLLKRPWNNRVGNWTDLAADFYLHPYHYEGVADVLREQGFVSAKTDK